MNSFDWMTIVCRQILQLLEELMNTSPEISENPPIDEPPTTTPVMEQQMEPSVTLKKFPNLFGTPSILRSFPKTNWTPTVANLKTI